MVHVGVQVTTGVQSGSSSADSVLYRGSQSEVYRVLDRSTSGTERAASDAPAAGELKRKSSRGSDFRSIGTCSEAVSFSRLEDCEMPTGKRGSAEMS